jgi:aryl-alcohol dehydrogenase-like predicted oxidoreductase
MKYTRLGNSGLKVSRVSMPLISAIAYEVLGCMSYGTDTWAKWVLNEDKSLLLLKAAWDNGIQTWDTADIYSNVNSQLVLIDVRACQR